MFGPQIIKKKRPMMKSCSCCGISRAGEEFLITKSWFYEDGLVPICNSCIKTEMMRVEWDWEYINKLCQMIDIPFIPAEFERLHELNGDDVFPIYSKVFNDQTFEELGWHDYFERFKELKTLKLIDNELPELYEENIKRMQAEWGANYFEEDLFYLEKLYNALFTSQSINGGLQVDQARKLCKMSLLIDNKIRAGEPIDKDMSSYDKLIKITDFTPKNSKNENDFDSFGEAITWLEKKGWLNTYFDGVSKDVVDEVVQNLQAFNQRLFTHESGIAEEIKARIDALKTAQDLQTEEDTFFGLDASEDSENYENDGYNQLVKEEEFIADEDE